MTTIFEKAIEIDESGIFGASATDRLIREIRRDPKLVTNLLLPENENRLRAILHIAFSDAAEYRLQKARDEEAMNRKYSSQREKQRQQRQAGRQRDTERHQAFTAAIWKESIVSHIPMYLAKLADLAASAEFHRKQGSTMLAKARYHTAVRDYMLKHNLTVASQIDEDVLRGIRAKHIPEKKEPTKRKTSSHTEFDPQKEGAPA